MGNRSGIVLAMVLVGAFMFVACGGGDGGVSQAVDVPSVGGSVLGGEAVSYQTEDGVIIVAEFLEPGNVSEPPIVILLHQFGGSRGQWAGLAPALFERGYAVLAPDLRSFGASDRAVRDGRQVPYELTNLDEMVLDVAAALAWLEARSGIDTSRIAVIGASVGANIAYVSSGAFDAVDTAIAMSPSASTGGSVLLGRDVPDFSPRSVLFMSDERESGEARTLAATVAEPVETKVYGGATAHGVALLANEQTVQDIFDWLAEHL
ncbi:MAG: alpha/beta fold hydrolase [Chloroflexi bacterium]|nr:alpha/beta fold hydrolase [Chloroflexota bacterium]